MADCLEKLRELVAEAAKPVRRRRLTRPTAGSIQRRLTAKRSRAATKRRRGPAGARDKSGVFSVSPLLPCSPLPLLL